MQTDLKQPSLIIRKKGRPAASKSAEEDRRAKSFLEELRANNAGQFCINEQTVGAAAIKNPGGKGRTKKLPTCSGCHQVGHKVNRCPNGGIPAPDGCPNGGIPAPDGDDKSIFSDGPVDYGAFSDRDEGENDEGENDDGENDEEDEGGGEQRRPTSSTAPSSATPSSSSPFMKLVLHGPETFGESDLRSAKVGDRFAVEDCNDLALADWRCSILERKGIDEVCAYVAARCPLPPLPRYLPLTRCPLLPTTFLCLQWVLLDAETARTQLESHPHSGDHGVLQEFGVYYRVPQVVCLNATRTVVMHLMR